MYRPLPASVPHRGGMSARSLCAGTRQGRTALRPPRSVRLSGRNGKDAGRARHVLPTGPTLYTEVAGTLGNGHARKEWEVGDGSRHTNVAGSLTALPGHSSPVTPARLRVRGVAHSRPQRAARRGRERASAGWVGKWAKQGAQRGAVRRPRGVGALCELHASRGVHSARRGRRGAVRSSRTAV